MLVAKWCPTLFGTPWAIAHQALFPWDFPGWKMKWMECIAISFSRGFSATRDWIHISFVCGFFTTEPLGKTPTYCIHEINTITSWQPTPVFLPGESHGQRNLLGYRPKGHKGSDTTKRLHSIPTTPAHLASLNAGTLLQYAFNFFFFLK